MAYSINVVNRSGSSATVAIYQTYPNSNTSLPLVWLSQTIPNGNPHKFSWDLSWGLNWGTTAAPISPGMEWGAGGSVEAMNPTSSDGPNAMTVTYQGGQFQNTDVGTRALEIKGAMQVTTDSSFTALDAATMSIAVYMNGAPALASPGRPDDAYIFEARPQYFLCVTDLKQGTAISEGSVSSPTEVEFEPGHTELSYELTEMLQFVRS